MHASTPIKERLPLHPTLVLIVVVVLLNGCNARKGPEDTPSFAERMIPNAIEPRFSGDGETVVYTEYLAGRSFLTDIYLMDRASLRRTRLTNNSWADGQPDLSPDGNLVVFVSRAEDTREEIWMYSIPEDKIYSVTATGGSHPDWHPSLPVLLYSSARSIHGEKKRNIYAMDMSSGRVRTLVTGPGDHSYARWSPDGRRIVYVSDKAGSDDVYIADPRTGDHFRVTTMTTDERFPAWSPDLNSIIFCSDLPLVQDRGPRSSTTKVNLWSVDVRDPANPSPPKLLFQSTLSGSQSLHPDFAPDGETLAFSTNASGTGWEVVLLDLPALLKVNRRAEERERQKALEARKKRLREQKRKRR